MPAPSQPKTPAAEVRLVVEQEKIHRLIDRLKTDDRAAAAAELVQRGQLAIPALLEALERRDLELRCRALEVMQRLLGDVHFDPYAPEALRHQQIALIRERTQRRAG